MLVRANLQFIIGGIFKVDMNIETDSQGVFTLILTDFIEIVIVHPGMDTSTIWPYQTSVTEATRQRGD